MSPQPYTPRQLYDWVIDPACDFLLVDVRNETEFGHFKVAGPRELDMMNLPYMEFVEFEEESAAKVPKGKPIRIVCAKEGSAKFVGEILAAHGHEDVGYLAGGIKSWGNLLVPMAVTPEGNGYDLYQFIRPGKASCSYGLAAKGELTLFDPSRNVDFYVEFAKEKGLKIIRTCETHLQADYIAGSNAISQRTGAEFLAPPDDFKGSAHKYNPATDGDIHTCGGVEIKVLHTPGHTPGSTSYIVDNKYLLSGDAVFIHSVGRPDLGGQAEAWSDMLFNTLNNIIGPLDDSMTVLPAHFAEWTEADESLIFQASKSKVWEINKDIFALDTPEAFYGFVKDNMREQPPEYAVIRLVNAGKETKTDEEMEILDLGKNECAASAMAQAKAEAGA